MNWLSLFTLAFAFFTGHQTAFPLTVHGRHKLVTISQTSTPGSTKWTDALGVAWQIYQGGGGTITSGVFSVTVQDLDVVSSLSSGASTSSGGTAGGQQAAQSAGAGGIRAAVAPSS